MPTFHDSVAVADIASLKALTGNQKQNGSLHAVYDDSTGEPAWYKCKIPDSTVEDLPKVVVPSDGIGRFFQFKSGSSETTGGGGNTPYQFKTANYTLVNGDKIIFLPDYAVESSKYFTLTLPATPLPGWEVEIFTAYDRDFDYGTYDVEIEINKNGSNVDSRDWSTFFTGKRTIDSDFYNGGKLVYINNAIGWFAIGNYNMFSTTDNPFRHSSF